VLPALHAHQDLEVELAQHHVVQIIGMYQDGVHVMECVVLELKHVLFNVSVL